MSETTKDAPSLRYDERPDIDFIDGRVYAAGIHPALDWMRENEPIYHDRKNDLYGVTRYADIVEISKRADVFRNGDGAFPNAPPLDHLLSMDGDEHRKRRRLVTHAFTPNRVAGLEARVREISTEIIDAIADRGECDFVRDVALPLPLRVIGDLLGVNPAHNDRLLQWSEDLVQLGSHDPDVLDAQARAAIDYRDYCSGVLADRRSRPPASDLMSVLVHAQVDGEGLDDEALFMESLLLLIAGDETTRHVISGGMHQLLLHPDQLTALRDNPSKIPQAVEEMLRWVSPVQSLMRTAVADIEISGHRVRKGDRLLLLYPSANRDDAIFEDPHTFDVRRDPNPHLAFGGGGVHFCLGAALGRLELRVMFEELLARIPDLALVHEEPPPLRPATAIVGIEHMPVRFSPIAIGGRR